MRNLSGCLSKIPGVRACQVILACFSLPLLALCPDPPLKLCQMVAGHDWVVHAKVESVQLLKDSDDMEGVAGWLYHLSVRKVFRGAARTKSLVVLSQNTTSRVNLDIGGEYFVFASKAPGEILETGNRCDDYSGARYQPQLAQQIQACVQGMSRSP
ncbi:hypothetical protein [Chitinimonas sp.]|uniref:hypothetical protein n=1 Tax=Chitinimonas sp. TaxID=1934313 RepID=UPI0035B30193